MTEIFQLIFYMSQAHTVYIPKNVAVHNDTGNDTSGQMDSMKAIITEVQLVRTIQYR